MSVKELFALHVTANWIPAFAGMTGVHVEFVGMKVALHIGKNESSQMIPYNGERSYGYQNYRTIGRGF